MSIVNYDIAPKLIAQQLEVKATAAGWRVTGREAGVDATIGPVEDGGQRYRTTFKRGEQIVRTTAYRLMGKTVLMVVVLKAEP